MTKLKSRTQEIMEQLESEGRVSRVEIKFDQEFYDRMEEIRRDFLRKQAASMLAASKIILD